MAGDCYLPLRKILELATSCGSTYFPFRFTKGHIQKIAKHLFNIYLQLLLNLLKKDRETLF
ncbi:MAG: hypothetical protein PWR10_1336 [Halanaerobiales bacterium]|nr:hypothetical protein [Halanaerobiales bacterium]